MEKKNKIIILAIAFALVVLCSGLTYAYFTAAVNSESGSTIIAKGGTMNITYANGSGNIVVENIYPREAEWVNKTFTITGNNTTDLSMDYKIYLTTTSNQYNLGDLTYSLSGTSTNTLDTLASKNNQVIPKSGQIVLGVGTFKNKTATHTYNLKIYYKATNENQNNGQGKNYTGYISIDNANLSSSNVLISTTAGLNETLVFNSPLTNKNIETIVFNSTPDVPDNALFSWDASENQNGSIMGYALDEDNDNLYEVYIGQNNKVVFGSYVNSMFSGFSELTNINLNNVDTSNVIEMSSMFSWCSSLTTLDLSSFDTSNVTNMAAMFLNSGITTVDLSSFDTSKVTNFYWMFRNMGPTTTVTTKTVYVRSQEDITRFKTAGEGSSDVNYIIK